MTDSKPEPRRLIFGPANFRGYDGVVIDAETGARWSEAVGAKTWSEFAKAMYAEDWASFVERNGLEDEGVASSDPFSFEEWVSETWESGPEQVAFELAGQRIAELVAERRVELGEIRLGGGSPGGNIDAISGPIDQLALIATLINSARDGFTLDRNDAAVEGGMLRSIWT